MAYLESSKYGDMIHGTDENDILVAGTSYVELNGDAGDDLLVVSTDLLGKNIANVTMTGGDGADTFGFLPREQKIFSAIITDFNAADGDVVIVAAEDSNVSAEEASAVSLGAVVGIERIDNESIRRLIPDDEVTEEEMSLRAVADSNVTGDFLRYVTDSNGEVTSAFLHLSRNDDTLVSTFIFQGITDANAFENADLIYADYNGIAMNRVRLGDFHMPDGLSMTNKGRSNSDYTWLYVSSEYDGDLWLDGIDYNGNTVETWTNGAITNINARDDTIGGRMLAGNTNDNYIYASDYGNSIWGGGGDQNWLYGGAGADTFIAAVEYSGGYNRIRDFGDEDVVYIDSISSEDIFSESPSVYLQGYSSGNFYDYKWNLQAIQFVNTADDSTVIIIAYDPMDGSDDNKVFRVNPRSDTTKVTLQLSDGYRLQFNYADGYEWHAYEDDTWIPVALMKGGLEKFAADNGDEGLYVYQSYYGSLVLDNWTYFNSIKIVDARNDDRRYSSARILSGNANDNTIYANQYGSYLWGGTGGNDLLIGGAGVDTFVANGDGDNDTLDGCSNDDLIILKDIALGDIYAVEAITNSDGAETGLTVTTRNGSEIKILSSDTAKIATVWLGDYSAWQYNYISSTWTNTREPLPYGLTGDGNTVIVSSDYEGDFWGGGTGFDGNVVECWSSDSVTGIDASDDTVSGRMLAGNFNDNYIYAGSGGASMWGGTGRGDDVLFGGDGADTFIAGKGEGNTRIYDCEDNDLVVLHNINPADISDVSFNKSLDTIYITTTDGTRIDIDYGSTATKTTIKYADGDTRTFDHASGNWRVLFAEDVTLPDGLVKLGEMLYVSSEYEGTVSLDALNNDSIKNIDASEDTVGGRILIGDAQDNSILAGSGGASMWGGNGGWDYLIGGASADTFVAGQGEGRIIIDGCSDDDRVLLHNINPEDITDEFLYEGFSGYHSIDLTTADNTTIDIRYKNGITSETTIQYADGSTKVYNHINNTGLPNGIRRYDNSIFVSSDYEGDIWLGGVDFKGNTLEGWSDSTIRNISYSASETGNVMLAGNSNSNVIFAGNGGNMSLWGGNGGNDVLFGSNGADTFIAGAGEGNTYIDYYQTDDLIFLWNVNLDDIADWSLTGDTYSPNLVMMTTDGTEIEINTYDDTVLTTTVQYADGSRQQFNHSTKTWSSV